MITSNLLAQARADITVRSGPHKTHLLELFTSESCSSCPPAEEWLSSLRTDKQLWKEYVPVAFHVDYWDYLGWRDKLADPAYSLRQRRYATAWGAHSVNTPQFVLNGSEWRPRGIFELSHVSTVRPGILSATMRANGEVQVTFIPASERPLTYQIHLALLGFRIRSEIHAGENSGRILIHDFVSLAHRECTVPFEPTGVQAHFHLPPTPFSRGSLAFAVWVAESSTHAVLQTVGGILPNEPSKMEPRQR